MSVPFSFRYSNSIIKPEQYWESSKMYGKDNLWAEFWIIDTKLSSGKHLAGLDRLFSQNHSSFGHIDLIPHNGISFNEFCKKHFKC